MTNQQLEAIRKVAGAMSELVDLWDETLEEDFHALDPKITQDLMTQSFDDMTAVWWGFYHELAEKQVN